MHPIEVSQIAKAFGSTKAVVDVSFEVKSGEIFGLLGPNGAGKTTAIRVILDIFQPDRGKVSILGGPMTEAKKTRSATCQKSAAYIRIFLLSAACFT